MIITESRPVMRSGNKEQVRLALALIDSLGIDGAIFACRANGWEGVLAILAGGRREAPRPTTETPRLHS